MQKARHQTRQGLRWAVDDFFCCLSVYLSALLELLWDLMLQLLTTLPLDEPANVLFLGPSIDPCTKLLAWASPHLRSRDARRVESAVADVYDRV